MSLIQALAQQVLSQQSQRARALAELQRSGLSGLASRLTAGSENANRLRLAGNENLSQGLLGAGSAIGTGLARRADNQFRQQQLAQDQGQFDMGLALQRQRLAEEARANDLRDAIARGQLRIGEAEAGLLPGVTPVSTRNTQLGLESAIQRQKQAQEFDRGQATEQRDFLRGESESDRASQLLRQSIGIFADRSSQSRAHQNRLAEIAAGKEPEDVDLRSLDKQLAAANVRVAEARAKASEVEAETGPTSPIGGAIGLFNYFNEITDMNLAVTPQQRADLATLYYSALSRAAAQARLRKLSAAQSETLEQLEGSSFEATNAIRKAAGLAPLEQASQQDAQRIIEGLPQPKQGVRVSPIPTPRLRP